MKKLWFSNLAWMLGCLSTTTAFGQYPGAYGSLAPSAFPIQNQQPQMSQPAYQQLVGAPVQYTGAPINQTWFGQRGTPVQFVGTQEGVQIAPSYAAPLNTVPSNAFPVPAPMNGPMNGPMNAPMNAPMNGPIHSDLQSPPMQQSMGAPIQNYGQAHSYQSSPNETMMNPVYGQSIAPGCTSCGSAPLTESYAYPMYSAQPYQQSFAPQFGSRVSNYARGSVFTGMPEGSKSFFAGGGVLLFHRVDDDNVNLTYNTVTGEDVLGTRDARSGLLPGFEVFLGRYFNCGRNAATISYWGLFPEEEMATVTTAGGADLRSRYQFTGVSMPAFGTYPIAPVYDWYDTNDPGNNTTSQAHRIDRSSNYHNVEGNLLGFMTGGAARSFYLPTSGGVFSGTRGLHAFGGGCGYCGGAGCGACSGGNGSCGQGNCGNCNTCAPTRYATGPCCLTPGCGSRLNMTWLAGIRYFRFKDSLTYASSLADTTFGNGNDDIYYYSCVENDLVGGQIGGILNYCAGKRASLYALTKMGVYGNHARFNSDLGTRNGHSAYITGTGEDYVISTSKTDVAFIGELGTGLNYRLTSKWSGNFGYRAVVLSGVATAVDQLPINMSHLGNASSFDNNAAVILHGVNLGAQYNY